MAGTVVQGAKVWTGPSPWQEGETSHLRLRSSTLVSLHTHPDPRAPHSPFLSKDMAEGRGADFPSGPGRLFPSSCLD